MRRFALALLSWAGAAVGDVDPLLQAALNASEWRLAPDSFAHEDLTRYLTVASVEVSRPPLPRLRAAAVQASEGRVAMNGQSRGTNVSEGGVDPETVVNIAKALWDVVKEGRPSVDVSVDYATATPSGLKDWESLSDWRGQSWDGWRVEFKNAFSAVVCGLSWNYIWHYQGTNDGIGRYLTQGTLGSVTAYASWGFTLEARNVALDPLNVGTKASPLASITMNTQLSCGSALGVLTQESTVVLRGDGYGCTPGKCPGAFGELLV